MNFWPRHRRSLVVAAFASLACLVAAACSPVARYRVLSTVFDGVPPPPGVEVRSDSPIPTTAVENISVLQQSLRQLRAEKAPLELKPTILSVHQPVADHKCAECHNVDRLDSGLRHDATLCDKCHLDQRKEEGWDHGPINLGTCIPCHVPHRSQYEHLLAEAVPQVCLNCHESLSPEASDYHRVENFNECTACHDPHRMY